MMTTKATTVIDYIVQRIADEGVEHCFGVPGDYAFPVGDAVDRNPNIKWIGCSNELNASTRPMGTPRPGAPPCFPPTKRVGGYLQLTGAMAARAGRQSVYQVV